MTELAHSLAPAPVLSRRERVRSWLDMLFKDHGFVRFAYWNLHRLSPVAWRAAQPAPHHLRRAKAMGVRTVINLRGRRDTCGSYILEREACEKLGLTLLDFPIRSRKALDRDTLRTAARLFSDAEHPVLIHCKSGCDRASFMSVLYLFLHEKRPLKEATRQLSIWYGHYRYARTGIVDHLFERFAAETDGRPESFLPWVETAYDPAALEASFRETWFGRVLVDRILRRE